jgi:uroporphyrinogen-III synthase
VTPVRILITRPEPDASRTGARLTALGHSVLIDPLLTLEPAAIGSVPGGPFAAVAATSANALRVARKLDAIEPLRSLPLFAVGAHTGEAARAAGFATVTVADGDATALARLLLERMQPGSRVLHLAGAHRAQDLAPTLATGGITVVTLVVYRMRPAKEFSAAVVAALSASAIDAALHYSPRSAATFVALIEKQGLSMAARRLRHLCLSAAVAEPLRSLGAAAEVAARPDEAALIELLGR